MDAKSFDRFYNAMRILLMVGCALLVGTVVIVVSKVWLHGALRPGLNPAASIKAIERDLHR